MIKSEDVIVEFNKKVEAVLKQWEEIPFEDVNVYAHWLAQTYHFVKHSTRLLALGAARVGSHDRDFHYDFLGHIDEEKNHDLVALSDIKALGRNIDEIPEDLETDILYQGQYYWLEYGPVWALFGYSLLLEGVASRLPKSQVDRLINNHGKNATRFIVLHSQVDKDHFSHGLETIAKLPPTSVEPVLKNLNQSSFLYQKILANCAAKIVGREMLTGVQEAA